MHPLLAACLSLLCTLIARADPTTIFDGRTLAGWEGDTATTWRVVDGCIEAGSLTATSPATSFSRGTRILRTST